jgi:hypothetical protein
MTRICSVGYSSRLLGAAPVSAPVDVAAAPSGAVGLGSPCVATAVPLTGRGCRAHRCRGHGCRLGYRNGGGWGRCDRLTHYRGNRGIDQDDILCMEGPCVQVSCSWEIMALTDHAIYPIIDSSNDICILVHSAYECWKSTP